jgi:hypothetical protein
MLALQINARHVSELFPIFRNSDFNPFGVSRVCLCALQSETLIELASLYHFTNFNDYTLRHTVPSSDPYSLHKPQKINN